MHSDITIDKLKMISCEIRRDILEMTTAANSGHPGGSLSSTDVLIVLYYNIMRHNPKNPKDPDRDRFVLSKGHAAPLLYSILARSGYFPQKELKNLRQVNGMLQGHPDMRRVPGVDMSTGSLGQGLSAANGMAISAKIDKKDFNVYCLIGDGESQEGQIWEAAMTASHYKLDNVIAILDYNNLQIDGCVKDIMNIEPVKNKWQAFGWEVIEIDAHSYEEILDAFEKAQKIIDKPTIIIAKSTKGKGISFMENVCGFHGKALTEPQLNDALKELKND